MSLVPKDSSLSDDEGSDGSDDEDFDTIEEMVNKFFTINEDLDIPGDDDGDIPIIDLAPAEEDRLLPDLDDLQMLEYNENYQNDELIQKLPGISPQPSCSSAKQKTRRNSAIPSTSGTSGVGPKLGSSAKKAKKKKRSGRKTPIKPGRILCGSKNGAKISKKKKISFGYFIFSSLL